MQDAMFVHGSGTPTEEFVCMDFYNAAAGK